MAGEERIGRAKGAGVAPHFLVTDSQLYREWFERVKGRLAGQGIKPFLAIGLLQPGQMKDLYALDFSWEDTAAMIAHRYKTSQGAGLTC